MRNSGNRLLLWARAIALAYWHLPILLIVGLTSDRTSWTWLALLAPLPWIGMAGPCLLAVIVAAGVFLPSVRNGTPPGWLTGDSGLNILFACTLTLFVTIYWLAISRALKPGRERMFWRVALVIWTLIGNLAMAFMQPRGWDAPRASEQSHDPAAIATQSATCPDVMVALETDSPCTFSSGGWEYRILPSGIGSRSRDSVIQRFDLPLGAGLYTYKLQYLQLDSDIVLLFEVTDDEAAGGIVFRINGTTMDIEWSLPVPTFNLSEGLVDGNHLYMSGIGFVCSIDLDKGRYAWEHNGLYDEERLSFNSFKRPALQNGVVVFEEELQLGVKYTKPRKIKVEASSGKLQYE